MFSGPANHEGEPGGRGGELLRTGPEDEETLQVKERERRKRQFDVPHIRIQLFFSCRPLVSPQSLDEVRDQTVSHYKHPKASPFLLRCFIRQRL